jgi:hypothetical protein
MAAIYIMAMLINMAMIIDEVSGVKFYKMWPLRIRLWLNH